jgi:acetate kinase
MKILVINCGSSSLKFQLIDIMQVEQSETLLAKGLIDKIGKNDSSATCKTSSGHPLNVAQKIPNYRAAIETAFEQLFQGGVLQDASEIEGVGHRVVHGGDKFRQSVLIDEDVENAIERYSELAPLHNPHNLSGLRAARELLPTAPQVAVFDTAFHYTIPPKAYMYAIPYQEYAQDRVRRYGFHGTSHRYILRRFAAIQQSSPQFCNLITCHLGNGCSLCAVECGRSIDTSMGFTPIEGLIMGTRSGDVDLGVVLYMMNHYRLDHDQIEDILNRQSGLYGVSGLSNDMRDLLEKRSSNERANLAVEMFCYRASKYIGSYMAALPEVHAVIFSGGIGENSYPIREEICRSLRSLGVILDPELNKKIVGVEGEIGAAESSVKLWVIPTNEELLIARDTFRCIHGLPIND